MDVGIVSDTHDDRDAVEFAIETVTEAGVDAVLHCGDFVAPFSVAPFEDEWAFHAVRGNNDGEWALDRLISDFGTFHGECAELELDGFAVAMYHGTSEALVDGLVEGGRYDYVFHGHTHEHAIEEHSGTTRVNPGGVAIPPAPDPFSVVVLDTDDGSLSVNRLE